MQPVALPVCQRSHGVLCEAIEAVPERYFTSTQLGSGGSSADRRTISVDELGDDVLSIVHRQISLADLPAAAAISRCWHAAVEALPNAWACRGDLTLKRCRARATSLLRAELRLSGNLSPLMADPGVPPSSQRSPKPSPVPSCGTHLCRCCT